MTNPISTQILAKTYDLTKAVNRVDLTIEPGAVYGLLGRNGAGKTTLLRLLLGIEEPTNGKAEIYGEVFAKSNATLRQRVAYIGQDYRFYNSYSLEQLINLVAPLYPKWNWEKMNRLLKDFELDLQKRLGQLSGGQRQKAALLVALSCGAELLILDEPAAALDPLSRRKVLGEMMEFVNENPETNTILFSTHIVTDLERVATRVGMMADGKLTHEFELDDIHDNMRRIQAVFEDSSEAITFTHAISVEKEGRIANAIYDLSKPAHRAEIEQLEQTAKVTTFPVNLEEFFVQIYGASSVKEID